ncbi:MAG: hypothetical protein H0V68_08500 [Actinobacteria bacterium]|nr:hypothetical protein [Actinomycetota bacterium]
MAIVALIAMPVGVATVQAAGNEQSGFTVGDCISDVVYGNEPNMANGVAGGPAQQVPGTQAGNVLPTQSPGPFVNNPTDPQNPTRGRSVGQFQQDGINIPELCRAAVAVSP